MNFANAAWGFRETPLEEQFRITADMGLSILEIGIANADGDIPLDVSDDELLKVKEMAKSYGVNILAAATGNDFTTGSEDVGKIKRVIDICSTVGIPNLRIFAGFTPLEKLTEEAIECAKNALFEVCVYAYEKNVTPVIETHGAVDCYDDGVVHIMSSTTDLKTLKDILNSLPDNAGICFDPANLYAVGIKKPEEFYNEIKNRVVYAHFKDFKPLQSGHIKPSYCGDSDMDWDAILRAMKEFDGFCAFEYENTEDIKDGLIKCSDYITERIEKL